MILPRDFTLEMADHDVLRLDLDQLERFNCAWHILRAELIRRGYTLHDWRDEASQSHKCRCFIPEPILAWTQPSDPHSFTV